MENAGHHSVLKNCTTKNLSHRQNSSFSVRVIVKVLIKKLNIAVMTFPNEDTGLTNLGKVPQTGTKSVSCHVALNENAE